MAMKKKPVTGMKDITPREMEIRDYVIRMIKDTYGTFGFSSIETPCVEHIENLSSKQGGENEKLIFKILKRGEKLKIDTAETEMDLVDGGLRYDLTVPLSRYYANNANNLPSPFKALQMGNVWRADRPQRGRYRQFMQCDIDILGESTILAEIELILATSTLVGKLDFENFTIRINDRRILKAMAACSGFPEESYDTVFIILDKMDHLPRHHRRLRKRRRSSHHHRRLPDRRRRSLLRCRQHLRQRKRRRIPDRHDDHKPDAGSEDRRRTGDDHPEC